MRYSLFRGFGMVIDWCFRFSLWHSLFPMVWYGYSLVFWCRYPCAVFDAVFILLQVVGLVMGYCLGIPLVIIRED